MTERIDEIITDEPGSSGPVCLSDYKLDGILRTIQKEAQNDPGYVERAMQRFREFSQEADQRAIDAGLGPEEKYLMMSFLRRTTPQASSTGKVIPFIQNPKNTPSK